MRRELSPRNSWVERLQLIAIGVGVIVSAGWFVASFRDYRQAGDSRLDNAHQFLAPALATVEQWKRQGVRGRFFILFGSRTPPLERSRISVLASYVLFPALEVARPESADQILTYGRG